MAKEKICGIYCIENLINHKKYIGQSINIYSRWRSHKSELNKNTHHNIELQNAWNKYGKDIFYFKIIEKCEISQLDIQEVYWINYYDSYKHGYNRDLGGQSGNKMSIETRNK